MVEHTINFKDEWVLNALMENTGDSIYIKDRECRLWRISRKMASDLGYNDPSDIYGQTDVELFGPELGNRTVLDDIRVMENRQPIIGLMESYIDKHGATNWTSTTKLPIFNDHDEVIGLLGITREINELKNSEIGFQWMATHDTLTSLANRFLLSDRIEQAIFHAKRNKWLFGVLFIDLNGFKKINDLAGHAKGDQYLKNVAQVLTKSIRQSDTVARIGGDEFVVLLEGLKNVKEASLLAEKLTELIRLQVDPQEHLVTAAIGVSTYPADGVEPEILLMTADRAMYAAKKNLGRF